MDEDARPEAGGGTRAAAPAFSALTASTFTASLARRLRSRCTSYSVHVVAGRIWDDPALLRNYARRSARRLLTSVAAVIGTLAARV